MEYEMAKDSVGNLVFTVCQAQPDVYIIGNSGNYMTLLVGSKKALLFDTGCGYGNLKGLVESITDLPLIVVNSHGHLDHACGNYQFAEVYTPPKDIELCRLHNSTDFRRSGLESAKQIKLLLPQMGSLPDDFDEDAYLSRDSGNLLEVCDGYIFDLGDMTLELVELPGYTAGSIGLLCPKLKLLLVGDAINANTWLFLPESLSMKVYQETLRRAEKLDFTYMIQGHWPEPLPRERMQYYIDIAEHFDFAAGIPGAPVQQYPELEARTCIRARKTMENINDADFAALTISEDKL